MNWTPDPNMDGTYVLWFLIGIRAVFVVAGWFESTTECEDRPCRQKIDSA